MKIVALQAENVKKLVAIEIRPDGNLVEITGRNGQGKTSVLDSIWWALAGQSNIQPVPIREGAEQATITLDLGELVVVRKFRKRADGTTTTSLTVNNADGAKYGSPQSMLDALIGELALDPLEFTRLPARQQYERLTKFVPDVDFELVEESIASAYEERLQLGRKAKELRGAVASAALPEGLPAERVDEDALADELTGASEHNVAVERAHAARAEMERDLVATREDVDSYRNEAEELRERARQLDVRAQESSEAADLQAARIASLDQPAAPVDVTDLSEQLRQARETNRLWDERARVAKLSAEADELDAQIRERTEAIAQARQFKQDAIAAADMPVDGLGFGDGELLLDGVPFAQASDAEQLRTSVAIAMAAHPDLRVIRVRDGSLLDVDALKALAEMADAADCQVWIERVDSSGKVGFVIEDGQLANGGAA